MIFLQICLQLHIYCSIWGEKNLIQDSCSKFAINLYSLQWVRKWNVFFVIVHQRRSNGIIFNISVIILRCKNNMFSFRGNFDKAYAFCFRKEMILQSLMSNHSSLITSSANLQIIVCTQSYLVTLWMVSIISDGATVPPPLIFTGNYMTP